MTITTNHPQSSYGIPVILSADGTPLDYAPGLKAVAAHLGLSATDVGRLCGVSARTVQDWYQGRYAVSVAALNVMSDLLKRAEK